MGIWHQGGAWALVAVVTAMIGCGDDGAQTSDSATTGQASTSATEADTLGSMSEGSSEATEAMTSGTGGSDATATTVGTSGDATTGDPSAGTTGGTTGAGTTGAGTTGAGTTGGFMPIPVHEIPGLVSITFYERTGGDAPTEYTFTVLGPELTTLLPDPLHAGNRDIQGTSVEFYDVHYSDVDGNFDIDGSYLTIAGSFGAALPAGGGLNLAEISLNYEDDSVEFGSYLASFVALGDNAYPETADLSIDGDLQTHTTMGNNVNQPEMRLRVTLGFKSSLVPE
jgi:hypothetical protein